MPDRWTTPDFDGLSWHDCHVHGLHLATAQEENGTADLELDLDFIVEWLPRDDQTIQFLVAPATLTFHEVFDLRIEIDYATPGAGMTPFSLDGIEREEVTYVIGYPSFRWRLPVNWPAGRITFEVRPSLRCFVGSPSLSIGSTCFPQNVAETETRLWYLPLGGRR